LPGAALLVWPILTGRVGRLNGGKNDRMERENVVTLGAEMVTAMWHRRSVGHKMWIVCQLAGPPVS
jgi:hypothetical protein